MKHLTAIMADERASAMSFIDSEQVAMEGILDTIGSKLKDFKKKLGIKSEDDIKDSFKERQSMAVEMGKALKAIRGEVARANFKETVKPVAIGSRLLTLGISSTTPQDVVRDMQKLRSDVKKMLDGGARGIEPKHPQPAKREVIAPMKFSKQEVLQILDSAIGMCDDYAAATSAEEAAKIAKHYEEKKGAVATEGFFDVFGDAFMSALYTVAKIVFTAVIICLIVVAPIQFLFALVIIRLAMGLWELMTAED